MYKPSTYLVVTYFPTELVTKVKPNINSVEVHPQLSNNGHPVDGALVGAAGSLWPMPTPCTTHLCLPTSQLQALWPWFSNFLGSWA
jgi:hypothetical protein